MTSIRKFVYTALVALGALSFTSNTAAAQGSARGHFTLPHEVLFGNTKIPAGAYGFSYDPQNTTPILSLTSLSGGRAGFIILVPSTASASPAHGSRLVLQSSPYGSYVTAMELPEFDMTLYFSTPSHAAERQIAKATASSSALGQ